MTSWLDTEREPRRRSEWAGFLALACGVPVLFFGLFFTLDFLLRLIAGWIA